ncbi:hypothetical protein D3C73_664510 [compost metagenome]
MKKSDRSYEDLAPNTEYTVELIVSGADISLYVDGVLKLKASDPMHNPSGTIGFYAGGFNNLTVDDIVVTKLRNPVTEAAVSPLQPNGANGWYVDPITIQLSTGARSSTLTQTEYSLDGGGNWSHYTGPVIIDQENGAIGFRYRSTDLSGNIETPKELTLRLDRTAPATTSALSPEQPGGLTSWYVQPVTLTLTASDATSSVVETVYSLDGGANWQLYTSPLHFDTDGSYAVTYRSTDLAGNEENAHLINILLDTTGPDITVAAPVLNQAYADSEELVPQLMLSDGFSGVNGGMTEMRLDGQVVKEGEAIHLYTIPLGTHTLITTASDLAGNIRSVTVTFQTRSDAASVKTLIEKFVSMSWIDNAGIANSLLQKLEKGNLNALINEVEAQSGKHLTAAAAQILLRDVGYLRQMNGN